MRMTVYLVGIQPSLSLVEQQQEEDAINQFIQTYTTNNTHIKYDTRWTNDLHNSLVAAAANNHPPITLLTRTLIERIRLTLSRTDTHNQ